mgnify:CR=1 FL=1
MTAAGDDRPGPLQWRMPFEFDAPPPRAARHWPSWFGIGTMALMARLPWRLQRALGSGFGAVLRVALGKRRRIAERNLALSFQ